MEPIRQQLDVDAVSRMLIHAMSGDGPIYRQIASSLRELIQAGRIPALAFLPSERALASSMAVSRTTVVAAFDLLRAAGELISTQGSGTYVAVSGAGRWLAIGEPSMPTDNPAALIELPAGESIDFSSAAPSASRFVSEAIDELSGAALHDLLGTHGYLPRGLDRLRAAIAENHTSRGLATTSEQLFITAGVQPAIEMLVAACARPGDLVAIEDPSYRGAITALSRRDLRIVTVARDDDGIDPVHLERLLRSPDPPKLLYFSSGIHSPTGAVTSVHRWNELAQIFANHPLVVLDDAALDGTYFIPAPGGHLMPPFSERANVFTLGSMSKLYWGGLRVGWIRGDQRVLDRLLRIGGRVELGSSALGQLASVAMLDRYVEAAAERGKQLRESFTHLSSLLADELPEWHIKPPAGGTSVWARLPAAISAPFSQIAKRHGVTVVPGPMFSAQNSFADHLRLPLTPDPVTMEAGVNRLAEAWHNAVSTRVDFEAPVL